MGNETQYSEVLRNEIPWLLFPLRRYDSACTQLSGDDLTALVQYQLFIRTTSEAEPTQHFLSIQVDHFPEGRIPGCYLVSLEKTILGCHSKYAFPFPWTRKPGKAGSSPSLGS